MQSTVRLVAVVIVFSAVSTADQQCTRPDSEAHENRVLRAIVENLLFSDAITDVKLIKNAQEIATILQSPSISYRDVIRTARKYLERKQYALSIVLFYSAGNMTKHAGNTTSADTATGTDIYTTTRNLKNIACNRNNRAPDSLTRNFAIPLMEAFIEGNDDVGQSPNVTVDWAWGLFHIGVCYYYIGDYIGFAKENEKAVRKMEALLGENVAKQHRVFGHCLNNAAVAHELQGHYEKALEYHRQVAQVYPSVKDWRSDAEKERSISMNEESIERVRGLQ